MPRDDKASRRHGPDRRPSARGRTGDRGPNGTPPTHADRGGGQSGPRSCRSCRGRYGSARSWLKTCWAARRSPAYPPACSPSARLWRPYTVGRLSHAAGRRNGLAAGFAAGALGAAGIVVAAVVEDPTLLFAALFLYGSGTATNLQARHAGTDLAPSHRRATAVSILVATTLGAVAGPNTIRPAGRLAEAVGVPALAGPFLVAALTYGLASMVPFAFLRPDPLLVARALG